MVKKKILITGGYGYIGGRLAAYFVDLGQYEVIITSRKSKPISRKNIKCIQLDYFKADFSDYLREVYAIIHLASLNEIDCVKYPMQAIDVNVKLTLKWLQAAEKCRINKFIYFSTIHAYGSPLEGFIDESRQTSPTHPYGITHRAAEDYVLASREKSDIDAIVLRLSNSFGHPLFPDVNRWTLLVSDLCRKVVATEKLVLKSSGIQKRDFIPLKDVCRAVDHLFQLDKSASLDGLFNLGGQNTMSIIAMTELIAKCCIKQLGIHPEIERPMPIEISKKENRTNLIFSIDKLLKTGYQPAGEVEYEIEEMLSFCQIHFGNT